MASLACPVEWQGAGRIGTEPEGGCPVLGGAIACTDCLHRLPAPEGAKIP
jgi:hypothetical protein